MSVQTGEEGVLIQGMENDMGWTMSIDGRSGEMVIAVAGLEHGFVLFGDCTPD